MSSARRARPIAIARDAVDAFAAGRRDVVAFAFSLPGASPGGGGVVAIESRVRRPALPSSRFPSSLSSSSRASLAAAMSASPRARFPAALSVLASVSCAASVTGCRAPCSFSR